LGEWKTLYLRLSLTFFALYFPSNWLMFNQSFAALKFLDSGKFAFQN